MKATLFLAGSMLVAVASAQISTIGQFAGSANEGFESFPNYNSGGFISLDVMGGTATFFSNPNNQSQLYMYEPGTSATWGLGGNGEAQVHGGAKGLGLQHPTLTCDVSLIFDNDTFQFGGWFGTVDFPVNNMDVTFYDASNVQIGAVQSVSSVGSALVWHGWQSTVGIRRIDFTGNLAPAMDDIQANPVPEPGSIAAVVLGLAALVARRRK
jgi:hypothetical protein